MTTQPDPDPDRLRYVALALVRRALYGLAEDAGVHHDDARPRRVVPPYSAVARIDVGRRGDRSQAVRAAAKPGDEARVGAARPGSASFGRCVAAVVVLARARSQFAERRTAL